jgi:hypothetical protein
MAESANGTTITSAFITDASGGFWNLGSPGANGAQVCHNGSIDTTTLNVVKLLYYNHLVYLIEPAWVHL